MASQSSSRTLAARLAHLISDGDALLPRSQGGALAQSRAPETRYTRSGNVHLAYQMYGEGDVSIVFVPGFVSQVEVWWEEPEGRAFFGRLGEMARADNPPFLSAGGGYQGLFDSLDGIFMARAYGWAFLRPIRKVFYNLTVTVLSVVVALVIGVIVLAGLLADRLGIESGPLAVLGSANLEFVGFAIVGLFAVTWLIAALVWRFGRIEERWTVPAG